MNLPGPRGTPGDWDPAENYRAVRAHEVMLNEATAAFEHAVLAPLFLLNGGALIAFLTLLGALADKDSQLGPSTAWVAAAVFAWSLGLVAAALAVLSGFRKQRALSVAHRLMRQRFEQWLLQEPWPKLAEILYVPAPRHSSPRSRPLAWRRWARWRPPPLSPPSEDANAVDEGEAARRNHRDAAGRYGDRFDWAWRASVGFFVLGALAALPAVV